MSSVIWKGYIKDQFDLEARPKEFIKIDSHNIRNDALTSASSSFTCLEKPEHIAKGDILIVLDEKSQKRYQGKITSAEEYTINTEQIYSILGGTWVYNLSQYIGDGDDKSWYFEKYSKLDITEYEYPTVENVKSLEPEETNTYSDSNTSITMNIADSYTARATTYVYSETRQKIDLVGTTDDNGTLTINNEEIGEIDSCTATTFEQCLFVKGWNKIEIVYTEGSGGDGWLLTANGSKLSTCGLFSKMTSKTTDKLYTLEEIFASELQKYCNGEMKDSEYTDPLVKQKLGKFKIECKTSTYGNFTSGSDNETMDMEDMLYELYNSYRILLDINIQYSGTNTITIYKISDDEVLKLGDNTNTVVNISPTTEITETNRLIIYDQDGIYRSTYVVKSDGTREKEPTEITDRYGIVNTEIVYSDDNIDALLEEYLPTEMYNHKITFTLKLISKIFKFDDFKIGTRLKIYKDLETYQTIITGIEYSKDSGKSVSEITFICGNVRTTLTDKLLIKYGIRK